MCSNTQRVTKTELSQIHVEKNFVLVLIINKKNYLRAHFFINCSGSVQFIQHTLCCGSFTRQWLYTNLPTVSTYTKTSRSNKLFTTFLYLHALMFDFYSHYVLHWVHNKKCDIFKWLQKLNGGAVISFMNTFKFVMHFFWKWKSNQTIQ